MNTQQLAGNLAAVIAQGPQAAAAPVLLEHQGSGYVGELVDAVTTTVGERTYLVLLGEAVTAPQMPTLEDGSPRFTVDHLPEEPWAPGGWVQVVDEEAGQAVAFVPERAAERTWQALVAEERRYLR